MSLPRSKLRWPAFFALLGACVGCDQVSKHIATSSLQDEPPRHFLGETVRLEYAENTGAFLGLGDQLPESARVWIFLIGTGALLAAVVWYLYRNHEIGWTSFIALSLIVAGGVGNLLDRALAGYVVDFVSIGLGPLRTGIFNLADVAITGGGLWMFVEAFRGEVPPAVDSAESRGPLERES